MPPVTGVSGNQPVASPPEVNNNQATARQAAPAPPTNSPAQNQAAIDNVAQQMNQTRPAAASGSPTAAAAASRSETPAPAGAYTTQPSLAAQGTTDTPQGFRPEGNTTRDTLAAVNNYDWMKDKANVQKFKEQGDGVYLHTAGWIRGLNDQDRATVGKNVSEVIGEKNAVLETKPDFTEAGRRTTAVEDYKKTREAGVEPGRITLDMYINGPNSHQDNTPNVRNVVNGLRDAGFKGTIDYIAAPNGDFNRSEKNDPTKQMIKSFSDEKYDHVRERAKIAGGLALDMPGQLYTEDSLRGKNYRQWAKDAVNWGNSEGLHTAYLISDERAGELGKSGARIKQDIPNVGNYDYNAYHPSYNKNFPAVLEAGK